MALIATTSSATTTMKLGTTRNLTEVFALLRNNAQQNKFMYANSAARSGPSKPEERMSLVALEEGQEDEGPGAPEWIHTLDEVEYEFGRIRSRIEQLMTTQKTHLSRSTFGEEQVLEDEQKKIDGLTEQVTSMLAHCNRLISMLSNQRWKEKASERKLRENAVSSLLFTLSTLTNDFRASQSGYLKAIKARTDNVDSFLLSAGPSWSALADADTGGEELSMEQINAIMHNDTMVKEREKEVLAVSSSIRELNSLFKDLANLVVEQGSVLDRIDFNVEQSSLRVGRALESVQKAERSQRANKKMHIICCLSVAIIIMLLLLITFKF